MRDPFCGNCIKLTSSGMKLEKGASKMEVRGRVHFKTNFLPSIISFSLEGTKTHCYEKMSLIIPAHLAVIQSAKEQELYAKALTSSCLKKGAWLGAHDLYDRGQWVTIFDEQLDNLPFVNWSAAFGKYGRPIQSTIWESCLHIVPHDGGIDNSCCDYKNYFFCKIDKKHDCERCFL